jgi:hypothetical protein
MWATSLTNTFAKKNAAVDKNIDRTPGVIHLTSALKLRGYADRRASCNRAENRKKYRDKKRALFGFSPVRTSFTQNRVLSNKKATLVAYKRRLAHI